MANEKRKSEGKSKKAKGRIKRLGERCENFLAAAEAKTFLDFRLFAVKFFLTNACK